MEAPPISTREFSLALLSSLSLPVKKCVGVMVDTDHNGLVAVSVTYMISPDDLLAIANSVLITKKV